MKPVFIYSLPRSGSTLLLRSLLRHPSIRAMSEGWTLLPLINAPKQHGLAGIYRHEFCSRAFRELLGGSMHGYFDHLAAIRAYWTALHIRRFPDAEYIVDKTPPYSVYVDEIMDAFPDAYHIIMWRDPLPVMSSFIKSGGRGRFVLPRIEQELFLGLPRLIEASKRTDRRIICVRFEELCQCYEATLSRIWNFLEVKEGGRLLPLEEVRIAGSLGDPGTLRNAPIMCSRAKVALYPELHGKLRKEYVKMFYLSLGSERLHQMGYDFHASLKAVEQLETRPFQTISDVFYYSLHIWDRLLNIRLTAAGLKRRIFGGQVSPLS